MAVLIPALDEEAAIGKVVSEALAAGASRVLVVDNGSRDDTVNVARAAGARVVGEPRRGYGSACLRGIEEYRADPPEVLVFLDGDYSDYPEELPELVAPIAEGRADLVIGSRILGGAPREAMVPQARFGNWLASRLLRALYGVRYTDLGPFRAIRWQTLCDLGMSDPDFGWTVEMQVKAAKRGVPYCEVPVRYRARVGRSKISGTVKGTVLAGHKILWTIFRERWAS